MDQRRRTLLFIWLGTAGVTALIAFFAYRALVQPPEFAGRTDPQRLFDDPTLIFDEPGVLGTAVEMRVTEAVSECMAEAGYTYRAPTPVDDLDAMRPDGYGIAAAGVPHRAELGRGGSDDPGYEVALYGAALDETSSPGGCAAVGEAALSAAVDTIEQLPYTLDQLADDAAAHPAYVAALGDWSECMARRGYTAASPDELMASLQSRLRELTGDDARDLADEERRTAADDYACRRSTLDRAKQEVAADLAPEFVDDNRAELETLIPPPPGSGAVDLPSGLGSGDVQVTIVWPGQADIDLYVTDPNGDRVYFFNRTVPSGGQLDRDARYPCGTDDSQPAAENVYWPTGSAPPGTYTVEVGYTSDCDGEGDQHVTVVVQVNGRVVESGEHTLSPGGNGYYTTFEVGR